MEEGVVVMSILSVCVRARAFVCMCVCRRACIICAQRERIERIYSETIQGCVARRLSLECVKINGGRKGLSLSAKGQAPSLRQSDCPLQICFGQQSLHLASIDY